MPDAPPKRRRLPAPFAPVTCYKLVCPVCEVEWDNGDTVPYFNSRTEAIEFIETDLGRDEKEPLGRALARKCRIIGCGEAAYDRATGYAAPATGIGR